MDYIYAPIICSLYGRNIFILSTKSTMDLFEFSKQILTYLSIFNLDYFILCSSRGFIVFDAPFFLPGVLILYGRYGNYI